VCHFMWRLFLFLFLTRVIVSGSYFATAVALGEIYSFRHN